MITFERFIKQYLLSEKRIKMVKELPANDTSRIPGLQTQFNTDKYNVMQALQRKLDKKNIEVKHHLFIHF